MNHALVKRWEVKEYIDIETSDDGKKVLKTLKRYMENGLDSHLIFTEVLTQSGDIAYQRSLNYSFAADGSFSYTGESIHVDDNINAKLGYELSVSGDAVLTEEPTIDGAAEL